MWTRRLRSAFGVHLTPMTWFDLRIVYSPGSENLHAPRLHRESVIYMIILYTPRRDGLYTRNLYILFKVEEVLKLACYNMFAAEQALR